MKIWTMLIAALLLLGCTTTTTIKSAHSQDSVIVRKSNETTVPRTVEMSDTTFANYDFKATGKNKTPFYGILPLEMHPGRAVADVLFFAPGLFFNLRTAFSYYEFDADNSVVRFKNNENDTWREYKPSNAESERSRRYFEKNSP